MAVALPVVVFTAFLLPWAVIGVEHNLEPGPGAFTCMTHLLPLVSNGRCTWVDKAHMPLAVTTQRADSAEKVVVTAQHLDLETRRMTVQVTWTGARSLGEPGANDLTAIARTVDYQNGVCRPGRFLGAAGLTPVAAAGQGESIATAQLQLPFDGDPRQYPGDSYDFRFALEVHRATGDASATGVPALFVTSDNGLADYSVYFPRDSAIVRVCHAAHLIVLRNGQQQAMVYSVLGLPAILGWMVFHLYALQPVGSRRPQDILVALSAVLLTILPLRSVLVPQQITGTTRVDYLLGYEMLLVVAGGVVVYVLGLARRKPPET
jgi:hypothetical protein